MPLGSFVRPMFLALLLLLNGCGEPPERTEAMDMQAYNHTAHGIEDFDATVIPGMRSGGGYIAAGSGGGAVCCISVPHDWKPGLMATIHVRTYNSAGEKQEPSWTVPVPQYTPENAGHFAVHFLRSGQVKVFVTNLAPWHPDYPLKGEEAQMKPATS